jgi:hypothetical protein
MTTISRILLLTTALAAGQVSGADRMMTGFPELPGDARAVAERFTACVYFSGEITGTDRERDAEIARSTRKLRCSAVRDDLKRIRHRYRHNRKVMAALKEADQDV